MKEHDPDHPYHAIIAPSSMHMIVPCPGSVRMQAAYPDEEGEAAREGTAAHWALEQVLHGHVVDVGLIAPNGVVLTQDMIDGAELMRSAIPERVRPLIRVEQTVRMARRIHTQCWGTPDVYAYDPRDKVLYIWDYKFGHGYVEVIDNLQLIAYAAGVTEELDLNDLEARVVLCVVQPRCWHPSGHVRKWSVPLSDLRGPWNRMMMAAEAALGEDPPVNPGEHCRYCRARHACTALHKYTSYIHDLVDHATPLEMPDDALGYELRTLRQLADLLKARLTGLEADAEARLRAGKRVPGWGLDSKPGPLKWTAPAAQVIQLGQLYGLDLAKPPEPITPTQARKAGLPDAIIDGAAKREQAAARLAESDPMEMRRLFDGGVNNAHNPLP